MVQRRKQSTPYPHFVSKRLHVLFGRSFLIDNLFPWFLSAGLGFITSLVFVLLVGVFVSSWMGATVFWLGEWLIKRMPFISHIYSASKQISSAISPGNNRSCLQCYLFCGWSFLLGLVLQENSCISGFRVCFSSTVACFNANSMLEFQN